MYVHSNFNLNQNFLEAGCYTAIVEEVFFDETYDGTQKITVKYSVPKDGIDYMLRCTFKSSGPERWNRFMDHLQALGVGLDHIEDYKGKQVGLTFRLVNENGRTFQNVTALEP